MKLSRICEMLKNITREDELSPASNTVIQDHMQLPVGTLG